jgi:hypothetical protein
LEIRVKVAVWSFTILVVSILIAVSYLGAIQLQVSWRFRAIESLLAKYRAKPPSAWPSQESATFWKHIDWFCNNASRDFRERLLQLAESTSPLERADGVIFAAQLEYYDGFGQYLSTSHSEWLVPSPPSGRLFSAKPVSVYQDLVTQEQISSRIVRDSNLQERECFLFLALKTYSEKAQNLLLHFALKDPDNGIRTRAIYGLQASAKDSSTKDVLFQLLMDENIRVRLASAALLAGELDPSGADVLFDIVFDPATDVPWLERQQAVLHLTESLPDLDSVLSKCLWQFREDGFISPDQLNEVKGIWGHESHMHGSRR